MNTKFEINISPEFIISIVQLLNFYLSRNHLILAFLSFVLRNATRLRLSFFNNKQDATQITVAPTIIAIGLIITKYIWSLL